MVVPSSAASTATRSMARDRSSPRATASSTRCSWSSATSRSSTSTAARTRGSRWSRTSSDHRVEIGLDGVGAGFERAPRRAPSARRRPRGAGRAAAPWPWPATPRRLPGSRAPATPGSRPSRAIRVGGGGTSVSRPNSSSSARTWPASLGTDGRFLRGGDRPGRVDHAVPAHARAATSAGVSPASAPTSSRPAILSRGTPPWRSTSRRIAASSSSKRAASRCSRCWPDAQRGHLPAARVAQLGTAHVVALHQQRRRAPGTWDGRAGAARTPTPRRPCAATAASESVPASSSSSGTS